ncbi:hypothetical protein PFISCL1PPCAC_1088, partial [Pristionchus fissidentatus]
GTSDVAQIEAMLEAFLQKATPAPVHVAPTLTRQSFAKQAQFNVDILNKLEAAKKDPQSLDAVISFIKERNSILALADKNPKVLEMVDAAKAFESSTASSSASSSSSLMQAVMLAQSFASVSASTSDRKLRASSPPGQQPFRPRAPAYTTSGAQFTRVPSLFESHPFPGFASAGGSGSAPNHIPAGSCYNCGQNGHYKNGCPYPPNNRASAKREAKFVQAELRRLLDSGAIEKAQAPRVVSPLSVVHGDAVSLLSRALLGSISRSQSASLPSHTRIPLSQDERGPIGELLRSIYGTVGQTDPSLQPLLVQSIEGAKASSAMSVYSGSFDKLRAYARERGLDPACPTSLVIFSLRQVQEGKGLATLKTLSASFNHFVASPPPLVSQLLSYVHQSSRRQTTVSHHGHVPRSHVDRLVQYASQNPHDLPVLRAAVGAALAFAALLRVSELVSLRWDDLNWSEGRLGVRVRRAKNDQFGEGRETFVSIEDPSPVLSLFQQYRSLTASSPWLFPSLTNPELPIKPDSFRHDLTQLCSRAGVERITPHQLRAGGAMDSIRRGTPIEAVQRRGRWKSLGGLNPYLEDTVEAQGGALPL